MHNNFNDKEDENSFSFPDVDTLTEEEDLDFTSEFEDLNNPREIPVMTDPEPSPELVAETTLNSKLTQLKEDYEHKIRLLNEIILKSQKAFDQLDEEVLMITQDIIKKITKHIIQKQISIEPHLVRVMIDDLSTHIQQTKGGLLNVFLSPTDFQRVDSEGEHPGLMVQVDTTLNSGDIIIRSKTAEVRAILEERIELLMQVPHD